MSSFCPLCQTKSELFYEAIKPFNAIYDQCPKCELVFMHPKYFIDADQEKYRYEEHNNNISDLRYVDFLNKLLLPLKKLVKKDDIGLDFGSGPSPVLVKLLNREGYKIEGYDPFFSPIELKDKYKYISCTEVVEHFNNPLEAFEKLNSLLLPGGYLAIMTSIFYPEINFEKWYYRHDNTHVVFYTPKTLKFLANKYNFQEVYLKENVFIWKKT
jgi:SAM-dependent methyltransferase